MRHALDAVPVLYFAVWKMMMFQAAVLAFAAFWATIDSQFGMVRVVGAQPLSRLQYQVGKWLGISGHLVVLTIALIGSVVGWAAIYSGVRGIGLLYFPMQEFRSPFESGGIFVRLYTLSDFYTVVIGTPLPLAIPAMLYFRRRDITE